MTWLYARPKRRAVIPMKTDLPTLQALGAGASPACAVNPSLTAGVANRSAGIYRMFEPTVAA